MTTPRNASIAAIVGCDSRTVQKMFAAVVGDLRAEGLRVIGVIGEAHGLPDRSCAAGFLRDIASRAQFAIYLQDAPRHTSCHLDESGIDAACRQLLPQIRIATYSSLASSGNRRLAAAGLTPAFETAIKVHKPILTSVSDLHLTAWRAFATDAVTLPCDELAVRRWWETVRPATGRVVAEARTA